MSQELKSKVAKALSKSLGHKVSPEDVWGIREESSGSLIAVTSDGHKARISTDEVQLLAGPGSAPESFEPPEPPAAPIEPQEDLPSLDESAGDVLDGVNPAQAADEPKVRKVRKV